jgi:haloalkane dehalogenase
VLLLVHGWPESSYMWRDVMDPLAAAGWRVVAPDLLGFGDSPSDPPHTWERQIAALDAFRRAEGLDRLTLVVHDWGGLIGLRWACDHPEAVQRLVISCTGFFADGRWHGLARTLRSPDAGEELIEGMTREDFGRLLAGASPAIDDLAADEYFKAFSDAERRRGSLELYRSGDMEKLAAYEGRSRRSPSRRSSSGEPTIPSPPSPGPTASTPRSPAPSSSCSTARGTSWWRMRRSASPRPSWTSSSAASAGAGRAQIGLHARRRSPLGRADPPVAVSQPPEPDDHAVAGGRGERLDPLLEHVALRRGSAVFQTPNPGAATPVHRGRSGLRTCRSNRICSLRAPLTSRIRPSTAIVRSGCAAEEPQAVRRTSAGGCAWAAGASTSDRTNGRRRRFTPSRTPQDAR